MGHIYREKAEIPIPERAHVNMSNAQVSIYDLDAAGHRTGSRTVIGRATSSTTMHPNQNFKLLYPELWQAYYGEEPQVYEMHAGLYAAMLGLAHKTGLYPLLDRHLGHPDANAVMDFVLYSIAERSSTAQPFEESMRGQMLFSAAPLSDSFYSKLFKERLAAQEKDAAFRLDWLNACAARGTSKVWLCIDGSNNDCRIQNSDLAEPGKAKSLKNVSVVSYIWAVDAADGRPITWWVNPGGMHDSKALDAVIQLVSASGMQTAGVILDKGFASLEVVQKLRSLGLEYVIKLTGGARAHKEMLELCADKLRWNVEYAFTVGDRVMFGTAVRKRIFADDDRDSSIGLFFDGINSAERSAHLICKVIRTAQLVQDMLTKNPAAAAVPMEMKKYLELERDSCGIPAKVSFKKQYWQQAVNSTGFSSIACSQDLNAEAIDRLYDLRDVSEKQYAVLKSQLDCGTTRVHSDSAVKSRMMTAFAASVLRTELSLICRRLGLDVNVMIRRLGRVSLICMSDGRFRAVHSLSNDLKRLLLECGIRDADLDGFASELSSRRQAVHSDFRELPQAEAAPRGPGRPRKPKQEEQSAASAVKKRGRPKGSRNKKTLEREQQIRRQSGEQQVKRGPGRPKGSKNKKTLERERQLGEPGLVQIKRGRGRPKGSRNKKTLAREAVEAEMLRKAERSRRLREKRQAEEDAERQADGKILP